MKSRRDARNDVCQSLINARNVNGYSASAWPGLRSRMNVSNIVATCRISFSWHNSNNNCDRDLLNLTRRILFVYTLHLILGSLWRYLVSATSYKKRTTDENVLLQKSHLVPIDAARFGWFTKSWKVASSLCSWLRSKVRSQWSPDIGTGGLRWSSLSALCCTQSRLHGLVQSGLSATNCRC